jgi:phosphatidylglycerophosphate synthase
MYLDDAVADAFVERTHIFQDIHPNSITITSLILNITILIVLLRWRSGIHLGLLAALMAIRCATDIFDGAVARKYDKGSKLGGYLDTLGDFSFIIIIIYFLFDRYNVCAACWIPILTLLFYSIRHFDMAHDHSALKVYNGGPFQHFAAFCANNTVVLFTVIYGVIWNSEETVVSHLEDVGNVDTIYL